MIYTKKFLILEFSEEKLMKILINYSEIRQYGVLKTVANRYCGKNIKIYIYIDLSKNIDFCNELSRKRTASKYERKLRKVDCKFHRVIVPTGDCINNIIERNKIDVYLTNDSKSMELYSDSEYVRCIDSKMDIERICAQIDLYLLMDSKPLLNNKRTTSYPSKDKIWLSAYNSQAQREYERLNDNNDSTVFEVIKEANKDFLYETAMIYYGIKISYGELIKNVKKMSQMLIGEGIKKGDVVSICTPNVPDGVYCYFAAQNIGAIPSMLHVYSSQEDMRYYFKLEKTKLVIAIGMTKTCENIGAAIKGTNIKVIIIPMDSSLSFRSLEAAKIKLGISLIKRLHKGKQFFKITDYSRFQNIEDCCRKHKGQKLITAHNEIATIVHTGGTTGRGKSVILTHENILSNDNAFEATIQDFEPGDTILAIPPLFHVLGLNNCILLMLRVGGKVVLIPKYNKYKLSQLCKKYHPEMIFGVPKIGRDFLEFLDEKTDLSHLKYYVLGGEEMGKGFIEQSNAFLKQHGANIYCDQSLGATECSCSMTNTFKNSYVPGSLGIPLINLDMKVVKSAGEDIRECAYNEYGEICFSGPSVMKGYLDEINENKEYIRHHSDGKMWFHTGDLGYINEEGVLFFVGRIKELLKINGEQVYPSIIKQVIMQHNSIKDCAVIGTCDDTGHKRVLAIAVLNENEICTKEDIKHELIDRCKKQLIREAVPMDIVFRDKLPETNIYKLNINELREEYT